MKRYKIEYRYEWPDMKWREFGKVNAVNMEDAVRQARVLIPKARSYRVFVELAPGYYRCEDWAPNGL